MGINISRLTGMFEQIDSKIDAKFVFENKQYEIEQFKINFTQGIDHKGQPQHEVSGGQIYIVLTQSVPDALYDWAKRDNKPKDGKILFQTEASGTVLEIAFFKANCVRFERNINCFSGTTTSLLIAPEKVLMNGIAHDKQWRED